MLMALDKGCIAKLIDVSMDTGKGSREAIPRVAQAPIKWFG